MRFTSVATLFLAAASFLAGLFLLGIGTNPWVVNQYWLGFYESLIMVALGGLLVFLTLPIALFGFDSVPRWIVGASNSSTEMAQSGDDELLLLSNKRIVGLSLVITGAVWLISSVIGLWVTISVLVPQIFCGGVRYGCPSIFSYLGNWILIAIGIAILGIGIALVLLSKFAPSELTTKTNSTTAIMEPYQASETKLAA